MYPQLINTISHGQPVDQDLEFCTLLDIQELWKNVKIKQDNDMVIVVSICRFHIVLIAYENDFAGCKITNKVLNFRYLTEH